MAKRQNFVVGSTNPNTQTQTVDQLNHAWDRFQVLESSKLDGVFNAVSDYSNDSSNEIANAIQSITGSQPTGNSQDELAGALSQMRSEIETTSLTFKGYVGTSAPSTSDYVLIEGNIWINSATMPTTFPIAASDIKQWNGTSWVNYGSTYTPADFDFFRNIEDNEGYYWFGGQWTIMSTDMSTTYFVLNQNTGKWEIKSNVNLPGAPTTTTPPAGDSSTKIATTEWVKANAMRANLFDVKWIDYELSDMSWLRADTFSWQDGTVYTNAYQHLVNDFYEVAVASIVHMTSATTFDRFYRDFTNDVIINNVQYYAWKKSNGSIVLTTSQGPGVGDDVYNISATSVIWQISAISSGAQSETIDGTTITYYVARDGHKIVLVGEENDVTAIYNSTGVAWYYILDIANTRFKLPRTKFGFNGYRDAVGNYIEPGVPNITGSFYRDAVTRYKGGFANSVTGAFTASDNQSPELDGGGLSANGFGLVNLDASLSSSVYGNSTTVQSPATQMYLYFYVGQFSQSAIEETAGLNAALFNNKVDLDAGNLSATGKETIADLLTPDYTAGIDISASVTGSGYTALKDGVIYYFTIPGTSAVDITVNGAYITRKGSTTGSYSVSGSAIVKAGDTFWMGLFSGGSAYFYPFKGVA